MAHPPQTGDTQGGEEEHRVVRERSTYLTDRDAEKLCNLFAEGLGSGAGYARILSIMERQGIETALIERLRSALLQKGDRLGEAFARLGILDVRARQLIVVAEEQGTTPDVFELLADTYGERYERKKSVFYAMVYPVFLFCLGIVIVPNLFGQLEELMMQDDTLKSAFLNVAGSVIKSALVFTIFGGMGYFWLNLPVDMSSRELAQRIWLRLPLVSSSSRNMALSTFCRFLRHSLVAGMDIFQSLRLAAESSNHPEILADLPRVLEQLDAGNSLCISLSAVTAMPDEILDHIGIGEETGRLDERLDHLAEKYKKIADEQFERITKFITFSLYIIILVIVILSAMYSVLGLMERWSL